MLGITVRFSASGIRLSGAAGAANLTGLSKTQLGDTAHLICQAAGIRDANGERRPQRRRKVRHGGSR